MIQLYFLHTCSNIKKNYEGNKKKLLSGIRCLSGGNPLCQHGGEVLSVSIRDQVMLFLVTTSYLDVFVPLKLLVDTDISFFNFQCSFGKLTYT